MIGEEGVEELLAKTIAVAVNLKLISKKAPRTKGIRSRIFSKGRGST